jgi:hypothetical protein
MKQYTIIKQFKINKQMAHYFNVLEKTYNINNSQFIRQAVEEKLSNDMKEIRKAHQIKLGNVAPF